MACGYNWLGILAVFWGKHFILLCQLWAGCTGRCVLYVPFFAASSRKQTGMENILLCTQLFSLPVWQKHHTLPKCWARQMKPPRVVCHCVLKNAERKVSIWKALYSWNTWPLPFGIFVIYFLFHLYEKTLTVFPWNTFPLVPHCCSIQSPNLRSEEGVDLGGQDQESQHCWGQPTVPRSTGNIGFDAGQGRAGHPKGIFSQLLCSSAIWMGNWYHKIRSMLLFSSHPFWPWPGLDPHSVGHLTFPFRPWKWRLLLPSTCQEMWQILARPTAQLISIFYPSAQCLAVAFGPRGVSPLDQLLNMSLWNSDC